MGIIFPTCSIDIVVDVALIIAATPVAYVAPVTNMECFINVISVPPVIPGLIVEVQPVEAITNR